MISASIQDFRSVGNVEIEIDRVTLLAGPNASGKTSVCLAIAAALTRNPLPIKSADGKAVLTKKDAFQLMRAGTALAAVSLRGEGGTVTVAWPGCSVDSVGSSPPASSDIGAGLTRFTQLDAKARAKLLEEILGTSPTLGDLGAAIGGTVSETHLAALWRSIELDGWDAAWSKAKAKGAEIKGRWREVTGEQYGSQKAEAWRPDGLSDEDMDAPIEDLMRRAEDDVVRREQWIAAKARAEHRPQIEAKLSEAMRIVGDVTQDVDAAKSNLDTVLATRADAPAVNGASGLPCPWCNNHVRVVRAAEHGPTYYHLEKFEAALTQEEHTRRLKLISNLDAAIDMARKTHDNATARLYKVKSDIKSYQELLQDMPETVPDEPPASDAAARLDAAKAYRRARELADAITANAAVVSALAPDGVRGKKLAQRLGHLNGQIRAFVEAGGATEWPTVATDMSVSRDGRPYELLSESERWRADVAIQVTLATLAGDNMIIIDGADVLDASWREWLIGALLAQSVPALVAMTYGAQKNVPDLSQIEGGATRWLT